MQKLCTFPGRRYFCPAEFPWDSGKRAGDHELVSALQGLRIRVALSDRSELDPSVSERSESAALIRRPCKALTSS